ncbi:serine O-acetyltransferase [Fodinicurvata sp. EGI_FJ10296]|uniref:serine O-acetyltransferase n=1 Tax=Fodinicurvata sp. EGI_FJ10296 TaxID=3231908 RepID=UPI003451E42D
MFKRLREDIASVIERDPAAGSPIGVLLFYPGIHAIIGYRLSHWLWSWRLAFLASLVSYLTRIVTGIEIHPGATIGRRFFIDHGTGVVIGGTAEIGDDVTLYQGVTLGGTTLSKGKRHPTLSDGVIVGANATILGPLTVGRNARVGANAVVLRDVPEGYTAVGVPARMLRPERQSRGDAAESFLPYGTPCRDIPDPVARTICTLRDEVNALRSRLDRLEGDSTKGGAGAATGTSSGDGVADESMPPPEVQADEVPVRRFTGTGQ